MGDSGTAIERSDRGEIERSVASTGRVDVVPTETLRQDAGALARESRARRTELTGRVLTLLSSLGNLALRIIEQRVAAEGPAVRASSGQSIPSPSGSQRRKMTVGEGLGSESGQGDRRRRRRQRGGS